MGRYFVVVLSLLMLQGCAVFNEDYVLGAGKKEYYPDGKIKSVECKSPFADVLNFQGIKTGG